MAYFTEITTPRTLTTEESDQLGAYISAQTTAGTTDGRVYQWAYVADTPETQSVRMWDGIESANGYKAILDGFSPAIPSKIF